jgi:predicted DNA-binding transcriptional regulator AlpA
MKNQQVSESHLSTTLTFAQLPYAVSVVLNKLDNTERLLQQKTNKAKPEQKEVLIIKEVSEFLHLSLPAIYALVSNRKIPFRKKGKRLHSSKKSLPQCLVTSKREAI